MEESVIYDIETTGLNPCRDRILAIGLSIIGKEYRVIYSENESKILQEFINELVDSDVLLVGWNSYSFDLPFIICRAALLEVDGFHGLVELDHLDAMKAAVEVSTCSREWLSQEEYAARLDVLVEDSWSGEDMPEAYSEGEWDRIVEHCFCDIRELSAIYRKKKDRFLECRSKWN